MEWRKGIGVLIPLMMGDIKSAVKSLSNSYSATESHCPAMEASVQDYRFYVDGGFNGKDN
jgi:hypothetical protein